MNPPTHSTAGTIAETGIVIPATSAPQTTAASRHVDARSVQPVLHVINGEHYSGAERVQDLLALNLGEFGYDVAFACVKPDKFIGARKAQSATLHPLPMANRFDLRVVRRLVRLVRAGGYRLIHAHTPRTAMVGRLAARWAGVPFVYHVHSPTSRDSTRSWQNRINASFEQASIRGADRLIAVSGSLGRHMQSLGFSEQQITVVPNGVPACDDVPMRDSPQGTWTLGTVALFRPRKGTEILIDALASLRERKLPVRLRCVGGFETVEYESDLRRRVTDRGLQEHVEWTGFTRDVNRELMSMDLFVLPSLFGEGLPMVVLEAMAAGVPVVATDVEGVPEAIRDGVDGVIARAGNAEDLAAAIARGVLGQLDWQSLRRSALARQRNAFSDRSMAAGVAAVYDEVLSR